MATAPVPVTSGNVSALQVGDTTQTIIVWRAGAAGGFDQIFRFNSASDVTFPASGTLGTGGGDANFVYTQVAPSASWSVAHNLGKFPAIEVVDSGGSTIIPNVLYVDNNNVTISFGSATSGKAYLN